MRIIFYKKRRSSVLDHIYYVAKIKKNEQTKELSKATLFHVATNSFKEFFLDKEFMDFSLKNEIKIKTHPHFEVLVYTKKNDKGEIIFTMKAFEKGVQTNYFHDESFLLEIEKSFLT
jgi:hypothetical protein